MPITNRWRDTTNEELEHLKRMLWDDWNFGTGDQKSFDMLQEVANELERRQDSTKRLLKLVRSRKRTQQEHENRLLKLMRSRNQQEEQQKARQHNQ